MRLVRFNRTEFKRQRWTYDAGEHALFSQPSQGGKTEWMFDLAGSTDFGDGVAPPAAMIMKAVDPTPAKWAARLGYQETPTWPPRRKLFGSKPPGYVLWPRHDLSMAPDALERTAANQEREFRKLFLTARAGRQPILADEIYGLVAELNLRAQVIEAASRGAGAKSPIWYTMQRLQGTQGVSIPGHLLNCPTHYFFGFDPVENNRKAYAQIGGINAPLVMDAVSNLTVTPIRTPHGVKYISDLLYVNKNGPRGGYLCLIGPT